MNEPRPVCPECGGVVDPRRAAVFSCPKPRPVWMKHPELLEGVYCCSDHLLDAYLRAVPKSRIGPVRRWPAP